MKFHKNLMIGVSAIAVNAVIAGVVVVLPKQAYACATITSGDNTINNSANDCIVWDGGNISVTSSGTIAGGNTGVLVNGSVGTITNSGSISATYMGAIYNVGTIALINNTSLGTITSSPSSNAIENSFTATIGTLTNSGLITGPGSAGIGNSGYIGLIQNYASGIISDGTGIYNIGSIGSIVNSGTIIATATGIDIQGPTDTIINDSIGTITGQIGIEIGSTQVNLINNEANGNNLGTISVSNTGLQNYGSIDNVINSGLISAGDIGISNIGSIGNINNTGHIYVSNTSGININNSGTIGTITNSGVMDGSYNLAAIYNQGTIGLIQNLAGGTLAANKSSAIFNTGTIDAITNSGTIAMNRINNGDIGNEGVITLISNNNLMSGEGNVLQNFATIGTIANNLNALISAGTGYGIGNIGGSIGTISNNGTITAGSDAISNSGTIGSIINTGTIIGVNAIASTGVISNAISNSGVIEGDINVSQTLTFTGGNAGTLGTLTGYNGGLGTLTTNNNNLIFDNNAFELLDDNINVGSGHTVINDGVVRVNTAHSITGNYSQNSSAYLVIGVTNANAYGQLVISGAASMAHDQILLAPTGGGSLAAGETFTIIQAANSGTSYANIEASANGYSLSASSIVSGGYDDLIVSILGNGNNGDANANGTYSTLGQIAGGGVAPEVGAALDKIEANILNGSNTAFVPILTALNNLGLQSQVAEQTGIKQLAPSQVAPQLASNNLLMNQGADVISQHQNLLLSQNGSSYGKAAGSEYRQGLFWGQVSGGYASQGGSATMGGYGQSSYGLTAGTDLFVTKTTSLGVAFGWMHGNAFGTDSLSGTNVSSDSYQLTAYGTQRLGPAFVNGMIGFGYNRYDQSRGIGFLGTDATASYGGLQYMGRIDGGWNIPIINKRTTLTPIAGFQAVVTDNNGYTETGAGAADLNVGRQVVDSYATTAGFKASTSVRTLWGALEPEVKLAWVHDLNNSPIPTNGVLGGVNFTTTTPRVAPDGAQTTVAFTLQRTNALSLRLEYDGDWRDNFSSNTGLLKATWSY